MARIVAERTDVVLAAIERQQRPADGLTRYRILDEGPRARCDDELGIEPE